MKKSTLQNVKKLLVAFALIAFSSGVFAQMPEAISIDPPDATAFDTITLTFNPIKACFQSGSLEGVPVVFMHSGVTVGGANWSYTIEYNATGANGQLPQLAPNGDGTYSIKYLPSAFYGIPDGTIVTQICAVFNDGQWDSKDGRDFDLANPPNCKDFFIPLKFASSEPKFSFFCNMQKAADDGLFDPLTDNLYVELLTPKDTTVEMAPGVAPNVFKYSGMIESGLDSGVTYNYKFRINADNYETVERQITATPGTVTADVWWNDEAINMVTFQVDMTYIIEKGEFDPDVDFMDIAGSMNGWGGSGPMTRVGTSNVYEIAYTLDAGVIYEYKFRINADWNTSEFPNGGPNRMMWGPSSSKTIMHYYDNYQPGTVPMTFMCHMWYQITAGHFDPAVDYLDVAGNMNGWGAYDVLFDRGNDSIYQVTLNVDTINIGGSPVEFKFRFNGNWDTSEFPGGGPNRKYDLQDTTGGFQNIVEVWYDNKNPDIPTPPWAYDLSITGTLVVGQTLTGNYTYENCNFIAEGTSLYQWYRADDNQGTNLEPIDLATELTYATTVGETGKWVAFEVTPIAASGDSAVGKPVMVYSADKIVGVAIQEIGNTWVNFYPNPVKDLITFEHLGQISRIVIFNSIGQQVITLNTLNTEKISANTSTLKTGVYFIRFINQDGTMATSKFIKY